MDDSEPRQLHPWALFGSFISPPKVTNQKTLMSSLYFEIAFNWLKNYNGVQEDHIPFP